MADAGMSALRGRQVGHGQRRRVLQGAGHVRDDRRRPARRPDPRRRQSAAERDQHGEAIGRDGPRPMAAGRRDRRAARQDRCRPMRRPMFPTDSYPLARRDILTLAGLASISPASAFGFGEAGPAFGLGEAGLRRQARRPAHRNSAQTAAARRRELYALMGDLPARNRPIAGKKRSEAERDGYVLETWDLDLNGIETVPAYLARPEGRDRPPAGGALQPLARRRLQDRQAGVHRGPQLPAAGAVREGADRARLRRAVPSITGSSASAATRPSRTCSRRCSGRGRCCGG